MKLGSIINKLRIDNNLSQEQFASIFGVSQQSVQKWESNDTVPELSKIVRISKYFGVSLDALIMGNDNRIVEELKTSKVIRPQYVNMHDWEFYSSNIMTEYLQSLDEGLDILQYKELFTAASRLPKGEISKRLGDIIFDIVNTANIREDFPFVEPSELNAIKELRKPFYYEKTNTFDAESQIQGAWLGRICGCLLGKTVEGIRTDELIPFLKETDNYPMHRYILHSDLNEEILNKYLLN